ncbi:glutathione S-transferase [Lentinus tigrinus ALCF2SS1-6]|uniref:Glutathione S-transferase n=1 Tax=Lentinus tigrinus ALCF2SS1-6 TaxID=1328759 RepID=A0A5C2RVG3_9APHY|nr:glutathione S-transferase [Lentinus tigrinus ALCF2SS1-6]
MISISLYDDKPEWYAKKVYPEAKIPYLVYGGPKLKPDEAPSPDTVQLPESLVILEFLADILPSAKLLPADPAIRAKARLFIQAVETKLLAAFRGFFFKGGAPDIFVNALEDIQRMLPPSEGYAVGEWSIADAAVTPFLMGINTMLKMNPPTLQEGAAEQALEVLSSPRFARLQKYVHDNAARPSMAKTWDEAAVEKLMKVRFESMAKARHTPAPHS